MNYNYLVSYIQNNKKYTKSISLIFCFNSTLLFLPETIPCTFWPKIKTQAITKKILFQALFSLVCMIKYIYKRKYHDKKAKIRENFAEADRLLILARGRIIQNSMSETTSNLIQWGR